MRRISSSSSSTAQKGARGLEPDPSGILGLRHSAAACSESFTARHSVAKAIFESLLLLWLSALSKTTYFVQLLGTYIK